MMMVVQKFQLGDAAVVVLLIVIVVLVTLLPDVPIRPLSGKSRKLLLQIFEAILNHTTGLDTLAICRDISTKMKVTLKIVYETRICVFLEKFGHYCKMYIYIGEWVLKSEKIESKRLFAFRL